VILRLLKLIIFLFLIGVISTFISYTEGRTKIDWLGWGIDLETSHFIMILILVSFCFIFIDRLWRFMISFPKSALLRRDEKNREKEEREVDVVKERQITKAKQKTTTSGGRRTIKRES